MNAAELKLKIFREIDALDKSQVQKFYGVFLNFLNSENNLDDWAKLSSIQKKGITDALTQVEEGNGVYHQKVMNKMRKKYSDD